MQAPRGALEQPHAQLAFQPLQALAGDRHRQVQAARGGTDGPEIEHAQEQVQIAETLHIQYFIESDSPFSRFFEMHGSLMLRARLHHRLS